MCRQQRQLPLRLRPVHISMPTSLATVSTVVPRRLLVSARMLRSKLNTYMFSVTQPLFDAHGVVVSQQQPIAANVSGMKPQRRRYNRRNGYF